MPDLGATQASSTVDTACAAIREAILRLESERLAVYVPRQGLVVATIGREEILDIYAVREMLDGLAARLAAQAASPTDLDHLTWLSSRVRNPSAYVTRPVREKEREEQRSEWHKFGTCNCKLDCKNPKSAFRRASSGFSELESAVLCPQR